MARLNIFVLIVIAITVSAEPEAPRFIRHRVRRPSFPGAEPPRFPPQRFGRIRSFFGRQEAAVATAVAGAPGGSFGSAGPGAPSDGAPPPIGGGAPYPPASAPYPPASAPYPPASAPYPAAGYRPSPAFNLPNEQGPAPTPPTQYGPPAPSYLPPSPTPSYAPPPTPSYGPPKQDEIPATEAAAEQPETVADAGSEAVDLARVSEDNLKAKRPEPQPQILYFGVPVAATAAVAPVQKLALIQAPIINQAVVQTQPVLFNAEQVPKGFAYVSQVTAW